MAHTVSAPVIPVDGLKELAIEFTTHRQLLARQLFTILKAPESGTGKLPDTFEDLDAWGQSHFFVAVDLARDWFAGHRHARTMFLGWVYSQLFEAASRVDGQEPRPGYVLQMAEANWAELLRGRRVSPQAITALGAALAPLVQRLETPARRKLRLLFLGDCLMSEVITALGGMALEAGIDFTSVYLHKQVPAVLRSEIRALEDTQFDLAFFGPFSSRATLDYAALLDAKSIFWPRTRLFSVTDQLLRDTESTLQTLVNKVPCPVYVHNTSGTIGIPPLRMRRVAFYIATMKTRGDARRMINLRTESWPGDARFQGRVRVLDEEALTARRGRMDLGRLIFHSKEGMFHPTNLGMELASGPYMEAVATASMLNSKKVVVCDLDNTLWDGIIGEGAVRHFVDRQHTLAELKKRGVLLSINSKNDPANVNFAGSALSFDDFVAPQINWEPKTKNMSNIASILNLKTKDFIFLDDRPDELERIREAFPEMIVLNACDPDTWRWLSHWQRHLEGGELEDRTRLYHERAAREQFLSEERKAAPSADEELLALQGLGLSVEVEFAGRSGLKRAAELINRTNQFNMAGSRTTVKELQQGLGVEQWITTASVSDKFGNMGVVGAMCVHRTVSGLTVSTFVLSCRVFGMGIEHALLNTVRELAEPGEELVGQYKETQHNKPGRHLYESSGLKWDGTAWVGRIADLPADPSWLSVKRPGARRASAPEII